MTKRKAFFIVLAFVIMSPAILFASSQNGVGGELFYSNLKTLRQTDFLNDHNRELYNLDSGKILGYDKATSSLKEIDITAVLEKAKESVLPLDKEYMIISSRFGYRNDPFGVGTIDRNMGGHLDPNRAVAFHSGIDLAAANILGKNVYSFVEGEVKLVQSSNSGYGNLVIIDSGEFEAYYAHLDSISANLKKGDTVKAGQIIGTVGSTGRSTGPHLHMEIVVKGIAVNPQVVLHGCISKPDSEENLIVKEEEKIEAVSFVAEDEKPKAKAEVKEEKPKAKKDTKNVFEIAEEAEIYNIFDFVAE